MANKVKFGLRNVYYSVITESDDEITYGTPVAVKGAVSLSLEASGDQSDFFADDSVFFTQSANNGYEGDLEVALLPDSFKTDVLGETTDANGALLENSDAVLKGFALGFEVQGDEMGRRTWFYNCSASRPSTEANTKEASIEPQTDTLTFKAMPRTTDKNVKIVMTKSSTNETAYNAFFSAVYEPVTSV